MTDVFISYATEDGDRVAPLVELLQGQGWSVWWDRDLVAGPSFQQKIQEALDQAKCVVVIWSEHSVISDWVRDEAQEGLDRGVLVPARIDDARPPLGFRSSQTASLTAWPRQADGIDSVLAGVRTIVGDQRTEPPAAAGPSQEQRAIAVLPFRNASDDPDQAFFSEGVAEDILNGLARRALNLIVRPASASFALRGEALPVLRERLAVTHVLEGSVRRAGNRVRVGVQLSDVTEERAVWSETYDRDLIDVFEVQDEITRRVLFALNAHLADQRPLSRREVGSQAYDAYLRSMYHARRNEQDLANEWFERAAELAPANPDLWAERARQLSVRVFFGHLPNTGDVRERARTYVGRALSIDPLHYARAHQAIYTFVEDRQYQRAIDELVEIVRTHPNSWDAIMYLTFALGAVDRQSEACFRAARRYTQISLRHGVELQMLLYSGRLDAAQIALGRDNVAEGAAVLAAVTGNLDELDTLVADDSGGGLSRKRKKYYAAVLAYLRGDFDAVRTAAASLKAAPGYQPHIRMHEYALLERDLDAAVAHYADAVYAAEPAAMLWHRDTCFLNTVFPEFVAYAPYQQLLKATGLDAESTARIRIPELPF